MIIIKFCVTKKYGVPFVVLINSLNLYKNIRKSNLVSKC